MPTRVVAARSTSDGSVSTASTPEGLVVRCAVPAMDALVARLVQAGIAVRELAPVTPPLEVAFLALTGEQETGYQEGGR